MLRGCSARGSAAVRSAPPTSRIDRACEPCSSIGASAQVRPWLPLASASRISTVVASPGSFTTVSAGIMAPLRSIRSPASTTPLTGP
ncbi:hypothetical protein D3C81_1019160 [compost metagenome]